MLLGLVRQQKEGLKQDRKDRTSRKQPTQWLKEVKEIPRSVVKESPRCKLCGHPDQEPGWTSGGAQRGCIQGQDRSAYSRERETSDLVGRLLGGCRCGQP